MSTLTKPLPTVEELLHHDDIVHWAEYFWGKWISLCGIDVTHTRETTDEVNCIVCIDLAKFRPEYV